MDINSPVHLDQKEDTMKLFLKWDQKQKKS